MESIIFYIASAILGVISIIEGISLEKTKGKIRVASRRIVSVHCLSNEAMKVYNSKWATMSYFVNGKEYISENRIQVPMSADIGDYIEVKYLMDKPQILYSRSYKRWGILLFAFCICILIGYYISKKY